jgi:deoxyribodipyrimidine photo-lyase
MASLICPLASHASLVVTDDYPAFMLPRMVQAAADQVERRLEAVNGLLPTRVPDQTFQTAYAFRRFRQRTLPAHLGGAPVATQTSVLAWAGCGRARRRRAPAALPRRRDHGGHRPVGRSRDRPQRGAGWPTWRCHDGDGDADVLLDQDLAAYGETRNKVERDATSRLSPYLHFGHISSWEVVATLLSREGWVGCTSARATGAREGWWNVSPAAEAFLDQIVTWRELGFNMCVRHPDSYDRFESLPTWAQATLGKHDADPRAYRYGLETFERARTHDPLWNASQVQLVREGRIHSYLRMLCGGKKILEWTPSARDALGVMVELNNKYAVDGRDPNSYSGIFWTFGRYDRPWAPEHPIFGSIRYMSSENTARKMSVLGYVRRYAPDTSDAPTQPALWT